MVRRHIPPIKKKDDPPRLVTPDEGNTKPVAEQRAEHAPNKVPGAGHLQIYVVTEKASKSRPLSRAGVVNSREVVTDRLTGLRMLLSAWGWQDMPDPATAAKYLAKIEGGSSPTPKSVFPKEWRRFVTPPRRTSGTANKLEYWVETDGKTPLHRTRISHGPDGSFDISFRSIQDFLGGK